MNPSTIHHPPPRMPYKIPCWLPGDHSTFLVDIEEHSLVDDLKDKIKEKNLELLGNIDARFLTLYRAEVKQPYEKQKRIDELKRSFQNLKECKELDEEEQLSGYFAKSPPVGRKHYIIVVPPQRKSIDP